MEIPDEQFLDLWGKISEALLRIAANLSPEKQSNWKGAIENFLHEPLTPKEERYAEELEQWIEKDSDLRKLLQGLFEEFREFKEEVRSCLTPVTQHQEGQFKI